MDDRGSNAYLFTLIVFGICVPGGAVYIEIRDTFLKMRYIFDNRRSEKISSRCNEKRFFSSNFENENLGFLNQRAEHIVCTWVTGNQVIAATALTNVHRTYLWNRM